MPPLLALVAILAASSGAQAPAGTDLRFFADAAPGVAARVDGVLEIVVSHSRKPSRGFKRLPFQPEPNADLEPLVDCEQLEPVPRASPRQRTQLTGFEVCGIRLLRALWGDADRIELAITGHKTAGGKRWLQVLLEPALDRRAWIQFAPGRKGLALMRLSRLADWVTGARRAWVPAHASRLLTLHEAPAGGEPSRRQLPRDGQDLAVDVLGVQGAWVRLALDDASCERARDAGEAAEGPCPSGWTEWRGADGQPLILP